MGIHSRLSLIAGLGLALLVACDFSAVGQSLTATPNLTARASALVVSSAPPQPSPSASPTSTNFPTVTLDPLATAESIDPCGLITQDEAASAIGEPVQPGVLAGGGCVFIDSGLGNYFLSTYAVPSVDTPALIEGRAYLLVAYGAQVSQSELNNMKLLGSQGDAKGVIESLVSLTANASTYSAQSIADHGDSAIWVSKINGSIRQSFLLAARGDALVGLDLIVTSARDEISVRDSAVAVIGQMLDRLPGRFLVIIPTNAPTSTPPLTATQSASTSPTPTNGPSTLSPTGSPTLAPSATPKVAPQTVTVTPTLKPPAFSVPIVSSNQVTYGGSCGLSLVSFTLTVADPSQVSPIAKVSLFVRVNDPVSGQVTEYTELPMQLDRRDVWLVLLNAETQLPGHEEYSQAFIEYYFSATNAAGISAESPHYGVQSNQLTLIACVTSTPPG